MKNGLFKRLISVLLSLLMIITTVPFTPITAAAADEDVDEALEEYEYFISVKTTNDADGWNWANVKLYTFDDDTYTTSSEVKKFNITDDIDDSGEEFRGVYRSTKFLDKVVVNIDFGGGFTWRDWSGELTVKINGTNVISTSMSCGSTPFSSSNRAFSNRVTADKYPKVDEDNSHIFVQSADSNELSSDLTFRQGSSEEKGKTQGRLYAQLVDQYDVVWKTLDQIEIKSNTHPDYDIFEFSEVSDNKAVFNVTSTFDGTLNDKYHSNDHLSKVTLSYPFHDPAKTYINDSDAEVKTIPLDINFKFLHDVTINLNKQLFAQYREYEGTKIPIDLGIPAGYRIKSFVKTGAGEVVNNNDNTAVLTVGNGDVTVTGNMVANTYYIDYNKNAEDATGEMTPTLATYDKASVAIKSSTFKREGYSFLGWNTKSDGSGTAFTAGVAAVKPNLTTENGAHVTLYAQWGKNVLTVVLNYPAETAVMPKTVNVNRLLSITPEEFIDINSASAHYRYTGSDKSLERITEDMSVNLYYEQEEHHFGEPFISVDPTCTTDGVETRVCEDCGYEKNTLVPAYHQDLRTEAGYAATCTEDGAETVTKCYACGEVVENGETIHAYGHNYNYKRASWSFSTISGELKGWATVTCKNDKTHTLTVEADVVKSEKTYDFTAYFDDGNTATASLRIGKDIFEVKVNSTDGGTVTATPSVAFKNDVVHLKAERETHYYLTGLTAKSGTNDVEIEDFSFVMPKGNVEVTAEFSNVLPNQCGDNAFWYYDEETSTLTIAGTGPMYDYDEVDAPWFAYGSEIHNLRKLNIEDGITYIGKSAFSRLGRIVYDVYIADSVTEIGERAFYYSDAVGHLRLSDKLEKIGDYAFAGCDQLGQQFVLPETITSLGRGVFQSDTSIYTVYCHANPENLSWTDASYDFKQNKATHIVVYNEYLSAYQEKFGNTVRGTFIGGLENYYHNIIIGESEHGSVSADFEKAPSYEMIRLSAVPDEGYGFSEYVVTNADGNSVNVSNNEFSMPNKNVTVIGMFKPLYKVNIETPDGNGTAEASKTEAIEGTAVKITPSPDLGYRFDTITVTDKNGNEIDLNENSFTMPESDVTASVTFAEYTHKVNCTVDGPGKVTGNLYADEGDTVKLTATPDEGAELKSIYLIDEYGNSIELDGNNSFIMPDCDVNLFAAFEAKQYTITYEATNGTVTGKETAAYGDEVKITAVPDEGYVLKDVYVKDWNDISFDKSSNTFIMPAKDITVKADFELKPFNITFHDMTNGTATCSDLTPEPGTTVTVTPIPDKGYGLNYLYYHRVSPEGWKYYNRIYDNKFVMPYGDVIIGGEFSKLSYPIIDKSQNGSVEANLSAEYNSEVRCKLVPDDGYRFDSVSIKDIYGNDIQFTLHNWSGVRYCDFVMPAGTAVVFAVFVKDETEYNITYSNCENGSVSGPEKSLPGKTVLINNTADEGYILKSFNVKANNSDVEFNEDLSFTMPSANVTVTAEYASNDKCGENAYWKYDVFTKTLTVYGSGAMYDYDGTNMPWYGMDINRVVVETGISYVGAYAFYQSDAETVYIPDSVEKIGSYAFYGSHSLKAVRMSERLTEIDTYAFAYCDALEQLDFPSLLVYVRDSAFTGTTAMDKIWCDMTAYDQLQWGSEPYKLDEFKPNLGTTILVAGALRNDAQWHYNKVINAGFYYTTAEANTEKHNVTVTTDAYGTVKSDFDSAPAGRLVYLTITPLDTYELQSLTVTDANGDEIKVTNNTFIMPGTAVTVNATFARKVYDVVTRPTSNGTVSCAESVAWGTSVPITVTSDEGYALKSLSVTDVNGNDIAVNNNTFTMPAASVTVSAEFEKQSYGITYRPVVNGSISGPETAERGDSIAINVISESNYKLASLTVQTISGESVSVEGTGFIMPAEPVIVRATFEKIDYDIVYKVSGNGKVTGAKTANYGDEVALSVIPQTGATLESLSVTDANGEEIELNGNSFTMPAGNATVYAKFNSTEYGITYGETEHGSITGYTTANYGSTVTVNATPETGYQLDTLTVIDSEENEADVKGNSFAMPASDVSVTATFKKISSKVVYIKTANGAVSGPETAEYGDTVSVSPIAAVGSELTALSVKTLSGGDIELTGNSFAMPDETVVVKAQFDKVDYSVTYNNSQGGTVTGAATANYNDSVELTVTTDTGYQLDTLTVTDAEDNELTVENNIFTMPDSSVKVNAVFKKIDYSITYPETEKGTVTGVETANYGDEVTLDVTPDTGCELVSLSVKDSNDSEITVTDGKFIMPASNVTVSASFLNTRYTVAYLPAEHGSVSGQETVSHGDEVALSITPEIGYRLDTLTVTDSNENEIAVSDNKFIMPESNVTVEASFVKTDHAITYSESEYGTVTGVASAKYGDKIELTITPNKDYTVETITVTDNEGNSIEVSNNTFIMPDSPVTVSASFARCYAYAVLDGDTKTLTFKYGTHIPAGDYTEWEIPSGDTVPWINYNSKYITTVVFDSSFAEARPKTTANWFKNFDALTDIQGIEYLNTSEVTSMSGMFYYCYNLTSLDLSTFDTSKVTNMSNMFYGCQGIPSLDLSNFDTSNVTNMSNMFYYCDALTTLDLSFFDTSKSPSTRTMFADCDKLETIYVEGFDTQWQSSDDYDMFRNCKSIVGGTGRTYANYAMGVSMAKADNGYFTAKTHTVTVGEVTGGTVEADKAQAAMNETVTLTATPDVEEMIPDYTVTDANGNVIEVTDGQFIMPASDVTVTASFHYITFTVQWIVGGSVVETDEAIKNRTPEFNGEVAQEYSDGVKTYAFCGWNDGTNTYAADELPSVTADVTYTAVYIETEHDFSEPVWTWADDRSTATATFTCTNDYCDVVETVNADITFNGTDKYTATVIFEGKEYTNTVGILRTANITFWNITSLAIKADTGETVEFEPANYDYWKDRTDFAKSEIKFTSGSSIDINYNSETNKFWFVMPAENISFNIYYREYRNVPSGRLEHATATADQDIVVDGELVTYTTVVDDGWKIRWFGYKDGGDYYPATQDANNKNIWTIEMPYYLTSSKQLYAVFEEDTDWHSITIEEAENGTVSYEKGGADTGDEVTLTVTPDEGYQLSTLTVKDADENEISVTDNTFTMPASNVTVSASFELKQFTVNWKVMETVVETDENVVYGTAPEFNGETPADYTDSEKHYSFYGWSDGTNTYAADELPVVTADVTYTAVYTEAAHIYSEQPEWSWADDYSTASAVFTCTACDVKKTVEAQVSSVAGNLKTDYTATADFNGKTYTDSKTSTRSINLWLGGKGVNANNCNDILGDGTAKYDEATNTLTLTDATIEIKQYNNNGEAFGIRYNGTMNEPFNIVLNGENKIVDNNADSNVTAKYGYACFASTPSYTVSGNGTLYISMTAEEEGVTYYGIQARKALTIDGTNVTVNIPGAEAATGIDMWYNDTVLSLVNNASLSVTTGGNAQTYSLASNRNVQNLSVEDGSTLAVSSDNSVANSNINPTGATKALGVGINTNNSEAGITAWNGETALNNYKVVRIPFTPPAKTANDIYNLTVEENIDVNVLVDVNGHIADGEVIDYIEYTYPDITTQEKKTVTETVQGADIEADASGYFAKSFTMAVAQANEPIVARVYFTNGTAKDITVSVTKYCDYIIKNKDAEDGRGNKLYTNELVNLCYAVLEYGKNAADYFNYEYEAYPEYTLPEYFNQEVSITSQAGIKKGSVVTGIASTQMFILSKATMRLTFKDDLSAVEVVSAKVGEKELTAVKAKNNGRDAVDISGIFATELNKPIVLELSDGTKVQYSATDWAKSILTYSTNESSKALAKSMYFYSKAANDYFSNQG